MTTNIESQAVTTNIESWSCDFDQVPATPLSKKQKRYCMEAETCQRCKSWYETFGGQQKTSRHRISRRRPPTPPKFWDLEFPNDEIPIQKSSLSRDGKPNKYDLQVISKPPSRIMHSKQGWIKAVKPPQKDPFD